MTARRSFALGEPQRIVAALLVVTLGATALVLADSTRARSRSEDDYYTAVLVRLYDASEVLELTLLDAALSNRAEPEVLSGATRTVRQLVPRLASLQPPPKLGNTHRAVVRSVSGLQAALPPPPQAASADTLLTVRQRLRALIVALRLSEASREGARTAFAPAPSHQNAQALP